MKRYVKAFRESDDWELVPPYDGAPEGKRDMIDGHGNEIHPNVYDRDWLPDDPDVWEGWNGENYMTYVGPDEFHEEKFYFDDYAELEDMLRACGRIR